MKTKRVELNEKDKGFAQDICRMYSVYYALASGALIMNEKIERMLNTRTMSCTHETKACINDLKVHLQRGRVRCEQIEGEAFKANKNEDGTIDYVGAFDALRNDGNYFVRLVCEIYNASRCDKDIRMKVESMLKLATKEPLISYDIIDLFKMADR